MLRYRIVGNIRIFWLPPGTGIRRVTCVAVSPNLRRISTLIWQFPENPQTLLN